MAITDPKNPEIKGLPKKLDNYLAFLDLVKVVKDATDDKKVNWNTFVFKDYDVSLHEVHF